MKQFFKRTRRVAPGLAGTFLMAVLFCTAPALGRQGGITGASVSGCTCHGASPSTATTVSLTSGTGSFSVTPTSTTTFTITVAHSSQSAAGVNLSAATTSSGTTNAGTLAPVSGSGLQASSSELTHTAPKTMTSGSASFAFTWQAPTTPGTYYFRAAGNAVNGDGTSGSDVWNFMTTQTVTVVGVQVTAPNTAVTWCAGTTQNITWVSGGIGNVKIELSSDGGSTFPTTITSSTSASTGTYAWAIPAGTAPGTQYRVKVTDITNGTLTDASDVNFTINAPPAVSVPPSGTTVCAGQTVNLSVTATGTGIVYQWRKDGSAINGANSSTYSIPSATTAATGSYDVVVTNNCGNVTSAAATVTVNGTPFIGTQPQSVTKCVGEAAAFSVSASGAGLTYQWRKGGSPISGATSSTYTIATLAGADAGNYDVVVSGTCSPPATSNVAVLAVHSPPQISAHPAAVTTCMGQPASFSVTASGGGLTYQWRKNGQAIVNATASTYSISAVTPGDAGTYDVIVAGTCAPLATSNTAALTVNRPPQITASPAGVDACVGTQLQLTVSANGTGLTYQWRHDGTSIPGATGTSYTVSSLTLPDSGLYDVVVSGTCAPPATSQSATVRVLAPPQITGNPQPVTVNEGGNATFTVQATGSGLQYQWRKGTSDLPNDTLQTLTITNAKLSDAGGYSCRVYNLCNSLTSTAGQLTVTPVGSGPFLSPLVSVVDFGGRRKDSQTDSALAGLIRNTGDKPLTVTGITLSGAGAGSFVIPATGTPFTLNPGQAHDLTVRFTAAALGLQSATVTFASNSVGSSTLTVQGTGALPGISVSTVNVGQASVGAQRDTTLRICNNTPLTFTVASAGAAGTGFSLTQPSTPLPLTLKPGDCFTVTVRFTPAAAGAATGELTVTTSDNDALKIALSGTAVSAGIHDQATEFASLRIQPNPAIGHTTINLTSPDTHPVDLMIVDMNGRMVRAFHGIGGAGNTFQWDAADLSGVPCPAGVYRVVVRQNGRQQSHALMLVR